MKIKTHLLFQEPFSVSLSTHNSFGNMHAWQDSKWIVFNYIILDENVGGFLSYKRAICILRFTSFSFKAYITRKIPHILPKAYSTDTLSLYIYIYM